MLERNLKIPLKDLAVCNILPYAETNALFAGCLETATYGSQSADHHCAVANPHMSITTSTSSNLEKNLMRHTAYLSFPQPDGGSEVIS